MITVDAAEAIAVLNGMALRMAKPQPVLAQIGEFMASKVMLEIMSEKDDPEGHPWAAWMPSTRAQRTKKGNVALGLLWDKGTLLGSIRVQTSANEVSIGSTDKVATFLQDGTEKMQAREIVGWSAADQAMTEQFVARYIEGLSL
jgi:phage virion morphogenesis protein